MHRKRVIEKKHADTGGEFHSRSDLGEIFTENFVYLIFEKMVYVICNKRYPDKYVHFRWSILFFWRIENVIQKRS